MIKVLTVFGTRPEALKMYPIYKELKKFSDFFDTKLCVTAQHREMLDSVLDRFGIFPDFDLNLMTKSQTLSELTSRILTEFDDILKKVSPDLVLVHGDTNTTFSISLSCFYNDVKVGHVEAGLRTYNLKSPWPEEFNRQVSSKISSIHFAPTETSKNNLTNTNNVNIASQGLSIIEGSFQSGKTSLIPKIIENLQDITNSYQLEVEQKELQKKQKIKTYTV